MVGGGGGWGGAGSSGGGQGDDDRVSPVCRRLLSLRQQAHLTATQDENQGGIQKAGAAEPMRWVFARA